MRKKDITELSKKEIRDFFLETESYCNFEIPEYFDFKSFLLEVDEVRKESCFDINNFLKQSCDTETSYVLYNNKDGKYAWRKFQLIHPIIYLELVEQIADNWDDICTFFRENKKEKIYSSPIYKETASPVSQKAVSILGYLDDVEKSSVKKALKYKYISKLDIADCYPSVYTHTIPWALHTREKAKTMRVSKYDKNQGGDQSSKYLWSNNIDYLLRAMQCGQTNGIPQGSILMDFIAEIVLSYIDSKLSDQLSKDGVENYEIIRYRDDYRIFTLEKSDNEKIISALSKILMEFNFKLNTSKTEIGEDIILSSIKKDKLDNIIYHVKNIKDSDVFILKRLLLDVLKISKIYPNSGFVLKILQILNEGEFYVQKSEWYKDELDLLLVILLDIIKSNPRCFSVGCVSVFNLLSKMDIESQGNMLKNIYSNLLSIENIGYNEIWLQRCSYKINSRKKYTNELCKVVSSKMKTGIFSDFGCKKLENVLVKNGFINRDKLSKITKIPTYTEVSAFKKYFS